MQLLPETTYRTILLFGESGTGKTTSAQMQGASVEVVHGPESDTNDVQMYTIANGDRVIDMRGLQDTRDDGLSASTYSDETTLRMLLCFLSQNKIGALHGIQWHVVPSTRLNKRLEREAKFIDELIGGKEGWKNVVVLICGLNRPAYVTPIRTIFARYADSVMPVVRGVLIDDEPIAPRLAAHNISLFSETPLENAQTLASLRCSNEAIQVCVFDEECKVCHARGDRRTYGRCHTSIAFKHGREIVTYMHSGNLISHKHDPGVSMTVTQEAATTFYRGVSTCLIAPTVGEALPFLSLVGPGLAVAGLAACGVALMRTVVFPCKRPGCGKHVLKDGEHPIPCYCVWDGCGCEVSAPKWPQEVERGGCPVGTRTCGDCKKGIGEDGCVAFCEGCGRLQSDEDFAAYGCASASWQHTVRRVD